MGEDQLPIFGFWGVNFQTLTSNKWKKNNKDVLDDNANVWAYLDQMSRFKHVLPTLIVVQIFVSPKFYSTPNLLDNPPWQLVMREQGTRCARDIRRKLITVYTWLFFGHSEQLHSSCFLQKERKNGNKIEIDFKKCILVGVLVGKNNFTRAKKLTFEPHAVI